MPAIISKPDISIAVQTPREHATRLELAMLWTRYAWAAGHSAGKDVAEISCGSGAGLGWIARMARSVRAGDPDDANCYLAQETYAGREKIRIRRMDAFELPFPGRSLDLVLRLESIDRLPGAEPFLGESRRVLRHGGTLLMAIESRDRARFPSPSALKEALAHAGFAVHLKAGFPARWLETKLLRTPLKRLLQGPLEPVPRELTPGRHATGQLITIAPGMNLSRYRTLYLEARKIP
jgi:ubiquinone/menaquinone biosynthesis C-methylase UbiE